MTKALILAAGQGSRLRPLTNSRPKCLVELAGKTLLSRQISVLNSQSISDIHVVTGYLGEQIENLGLPTSNNKNFDRTNMVSSLFCAMDFIVNSKEDLIVSYGDIVFDPENLRALLDSTEEVSLMIDQNWKELWSLRIENPLDDAETLKLDENNFVTELGKKPTNYDEIQGQYTGLIKIRADMLGKLVSFYKSLDRGLQFDGNDFSNMYMTSFIQLLINSGWNVKAVNVISGWLEIDTVADLTIYEKLAQRSELQKFYRS